MHPVLLIDELLREVFDLCSLDNEYRKTLVELARCCQAWKGPALQKAWENLPCITPLTKLVATDGVFAEELDNYARMVKHVKLGTKVERDVALESSSHDTTPLFQNLQSVAVLMDGCAAPAVHLLLSPMLTSVTIDIGVSTGRATGVERSGNIATYLSTLRSSSLPIQKLNIRGFACEQLNQAVYKLYTLKSLSLKLGTSLSTTTVTNIAKFPLLEELCIHADRVDAGSLKESIASSSSPIFPRLQTLEIRSSVEVATAIVEHTQSATFTRVSVEVIQEDDSTWTHLYSVIPTTTQAIHIDHHIDLDEPTSDNPDTINDHPFTIKKLSALSKLTALRTFTLESNAPVDFVDKDVEELTKWWPALEILDLAISPYWECKEQIAAWTPKLTVGCLRSVAKGWPNLARLGLPINLASEPKQVQIFPLHTRLNEFKIVPSVHGESCTPHIDANIAFVRNLFPSVRDHFRIFN